MVCMVKKLPTATFILRGKSEKYTKENMPVECFGSHFSHNVPFNLISFSAADDGFNLLLVIARLTF